LFFLLTLGTMFIIQGAVTMVTAGLAKYLTGTSLSLWYWMLIILAISSVLLSSGKIKVLDKFMKIVMVILAVTTIAAAISSFFANVPQATLAPPFNLTNTEHIFFLIAFIGWMPAPIDISVWYSVWSESKASETKELPSLKSSMFDFNIGYWGTAFLAFCFVALGAFMLHNTGIKLSSNAVIFSGQIIDAYTNSLGTWAKPIISIAAFTTMFSTTVSVMDGITRVLVPTSQYLLSNTEKESQSKKSYTIWLLILGTGALILVGKFADNMKQMVDFATSISFLTAPILAYLNVRVMSSSDIKPEFKPSRFTVNVSYIGLVILTGFSIVYIYYKFVL